MAHPILEAQDALKALLQARPAYTAAEVDVRDGSPTEGEDVTANAFWFNDVTNIESDWSALASTMPRKVGFSIGFSIMARSLGDDERTTRAVALGLLDDLEKTIKANPRLGIPTILQGVRTVTGTLVSQPVMPDGWGALVIGSIDCESTHY